MSDIRSSVRGPGGRPGPARLARSHTGAGDGGVRPHAEGQLAGGRDHWPWVYSVALAGGGTAAGVVYGASDKIAAYPRAHPHDPADLAATVYHLLGVPGETMIYDATHRPHPLVRGQKIDGLLA